METISVLGCGGCWGYRCSGHRSLSEEDVTGITEGLKNTYSLHSLSVSGLHWPKKDIDWICELNEAGRRYMVEKNTLEEGIQVLSRVNEWNASGNLSSLYFHLRENVVTFFGVKTSTKRWDDLGELEPTNR